MMRIQEAKGATMASALRADGDSLHFDLPCINKANSSSSIIYYD